MGGDMQFQFRVKGPFSPALAPQTPGSSDPLALTFVVSNLWPGLCHYWKKCPRRAGGERGDWEGPLFFFGEKRVLWFFSYEILDYL